MGAEHGNQADLDAAKQEGYAEGLAQNAAAVFVEPANLQLIVGNADYQVIPDISDTSICGNIQPCL